MAQKAALVSAFGTAWEPAESFRDESTATISPVSQPAIPASQCLFSQQRGFGAFVKDTHDRAHMFQ
jgi:hypothetical protein